MELLKTGSQPASVIGRTLGLPRTSAGFIAESLCQKGFLNKTLKGRTSYYKPEKLDNIKSLLELRGERYIQNLERQKKELEDIVQSFGRHESETRRHPKVVFYEGVDNVLLSFKEFINHLSHQHTLYNIVSPAPLEYKDFRTGMQYFIKTRAQKNIPCKTIATYCEDAIRLKVTDKEANRETRIGLYYDPKLFFSEILIGGGMVLEVSYSKEGIFSSLNQNANLARMQTSLFKTAWDQAKKYDEKMMKKTKTKIWIKKLEGIKEY